MTHFQDPSERMYAQPLCGAHWCAPITTNPESITCRVCASILIGGAP